jgi:hypothetical protein
VRSYFLARLIGALASPVCAERQFDRAPLSVPYQQRSACPLSFAHDAAALRGLTVAARDVPTAIDRACDRKDAPGTVIVGDVARHDVAGRIQADAIFAVAARRVFRNQVVGRTPAGRFFKRWVPCPSLEVTAVTRMPSSAAPVIVLWASAQDGGP